MNHAFIRRLALSLVAAGATACGGSADLEVHTEEEPLDDHSNVALQGLMDCSERQDTGYQNGRAFTITVISADGRPVEKATGNAYAVMQEAAARQGVRLRVVSGFRTMAEQEHLYWCYQTKRCNGGNLAARPGYSNHQSGHALDLNTSEGGVYNWLANNGARFGFKRTVPSEAWHWEWWGGGPGGGPCTGMVRGAILEKYNSLGGASSFLGQPTTYETPTPDGVGRYNHFQGGSIYWHPAVGAHELHGGIREKWASMGWEQGFLGYPWTDESGTPDGVGRYQHFQGGSIYWHPSIGARFIRGGIRNKWAELGWENSALGYPVSDEYAIPTGARSDFQNGSLLWDDGTGQVTVWLPGRAHWMPADLDGNGKQDLVNVYFISPPGLRIHSLLGNGDGTYRTAWMDLPGFGAGDVKVWQVADVNGDKKSDLVHVYHTGSGLRVHTLLGKGDGTWTYVANDAWGGFGARDTEQWRVADVNGDGKADLVHVYYASGIRVHTMLSRGDGTWQIVAQDAAPGFGAQDVSRWQPMDVNGDKKTDLVHVFHTGSGLRVHTLFANGDGTWRYAWQDSWNGFGARDVSRWKNADVNGDGKADLVHVYFANGIRVHAMISRGDGTWNIAAQDAAPGFGAQDVDTWKVADVNGDKKSDLVHVFHTGSGLRVHTLFGSGDGTWRYAWQDSWGGFGANDTARWRITDVNGDGKSDLVHSYWLAPGARIHTQTSAGDGNWSIRAQDAWPGYGDTFD